MYFFIINIDSRHRIQEHCYYFATDGEGKGVEEPCTILKKDMHRAPARGVSSVLASSSLLSSRGTMELRSR